MNANQRSDGVKDLMALFHYGSSLSIKPKTRQRNMCTDNKVVLGVDMSEVEK